MHNIPGPMLSLMSQCQDPSRLLQTPVGSPGARPRPPGHQHQPPIPPHNYHHHHWHLLKWYFQSIWEHEQLEQSNLSLKYQSKV